MGVSVEGYVWRGQTKLSEGVGAWDWWC